jgi:lycopene beta-cyclase
MSANKLPLSNHFDFIFAGGGAAGLSLAAQIASSPLKDRSILIIDRDRKQNNDRTWCFWSQSPTLFDSIAYRVWQQVEFISPGFERIYPLNPYHYQMIRGIDFYQYTRQYLRQFPSIQFLNAHVDQITDGDQAAQVTAAGQTYTADWVFNSLYLFDQIQPDPSRYHFLKQHFKGWEVETSQDVFNPDLPRLFDFRVAQQDEMRFVYILPFSPRRALVEFTLFSANLLEDAQYEAVLRDYTAKFLSLQNFSINQVENGVIPMTDQPFARRAGQRVLNIGTRGGRVKPSSGYAFLRIQHDSAAILQSMLQQGHPFHLPESPARYRLFDSILLQILYRHGGLSQSIFTALFKNNPIQRIFRFLDEEAPILENAALMATLPTWPFLRALIKLKLLRRI